MPASVNLGLYELNTEFVTLTFTQAAGGAAEDLTSATLELFIKDTADTADTDPGTVKLVSPTDITITDAAGGLAEFRVPAEVVAAPGQKFWRVDIVADAGETRRTAGYGPVTIENL